MKASDKICIRQQQHVVDVLCETLESVSYNAAIGKITLFAGRGGDELYRALRELHINLRKREEILHVRHTQTGAGPAHAGTD